MKHSTTGTYIIIALAAVTVGIIAFSRRAAIEVVYPIERVSMFVKRSVWPRVKGVFDGPGYAAENARLRREVATLSMLSGEVERLEEENAGLRRSLDYAAKSSKRWLAAPVLVVHGAAAGRTKSIRVGRGKADGVYENAIVASPDGLVGVVSLVTEHTSEVMLITDSRVEVVCSVSLGNGRTATGILRGGSEEELALTHIRGLSVDVPKAQVLTSRRGGVFPGGLVIGSLIQSSATDSGEWKGTVRPAVDFGNLEDAFIRCER